MKKKSGIIISQTLLSQEKMQVKNNKMIDINVYALEITGEVNKLIYKRDKNHIQNVIGKKITYQITKDGLIYNSKTSDNKKKIQFNKLELEAIKLYQSQGYSKEKAIELLNKN